MKKIQIFFGLTILSLSLGAVSALACRNVVAVYSTTGDHAYVSCSLTGEDSNYCYYDCTCSGTPSRCDQMYASAGLENV